jgi:predicted DsbA family dithiol-disulfide isomerase
MDVTSVDFYFDPMCPWAYQTSKWIRAVRDETGLDIRWRFFSLEEINRVDGKKHPWEREWSFGWSQMRVGAYLRRQGQEAVDRWYAGVGEAFFERGVPTQHREVHEDVLADLGFDRGAVAAACADETTTDEVRADHDHAVAEHAAFGVPTLVFPDGSARYGPVIVPAPTGEAAVRLWDWTVASLEWGDLFELKQPKTHDAQRKIAQAFKPYLEARTWNTIQNPTP